MASNQRWHKVIKGADKFYEISGKAVAVLVLFFTVMLAIEVISRYAFNHPTVWAHEMTAYLFGSYFMLGGAYGLLHKSHVAVDIAYKRTPLKFRTTILDSLAFVFIILICITLVWHGGQIAWDLLLMGERSSSIVFAIPIYPLRIIIPVSGVLVAVQALIKLVRNFHILTAGRDIE